MWRPRGPDEDGGAEGASASSKRGPPLAGTDTKREADKAVSPKGATGSRSSQRAASPAPSHKSSDGERSRRADALRRKVNAFVDDRDLSGRGRRVRVPQW